ncbi:hypothetical protein GCM10010430_41130 [Kitasatospora cystarginea]|uniref:Uncharacterized protein n=1 Tax=Kitasatospora cystarginea TaxID=58350 RepID=A0ABN3EC71_9ACTN
MSGSSGRTWVDRAYGGRYAVKRWTRHVAGKRGGHRVHLDQPAVHPDQPAVHPDRSPRSARACADGRGPGAPEDGRRHSDRMRSNRSILLTRH